MHSRLNGFLKGILILRRGDGDGWGKWVWLRQVDEENWLWLRQVVMERAR